MEHRNHGRDIVNQKELLTRIINDKDAVIFDFDNIIVDSEQYHFEAYSRVFARRGHTLDRSEYWREWTSRGGGAEGEISRYNLHLDPDEIRREKDPIYSEFCRAKIRPFPEVISLIEALKQAGFTLAIASGSYQHDIRTILTANGIEGYFSAVIGKDGVTKYKPHPETYLRAAEKIGIPPEKCLVIEDAEKGVKSAKDAGMEVIVVETPITRGFDFRAADLLFSSLSEFAELLQDVLAEKK